MCASHVENRNCCLCCKYCNKNQGSDFQKLLHLKDTGIVIYKYKLNHPTEPVLDDIFILHNTKDTDVPQEVFIPEFEHQKVECPKCKHLMDRTEKILTSVKTLNKNEIRSICEHCRKKMQSQFPCNNCEKAANKFMSTFGKLMEYPKTKTDLKSWIEEQHLLKHLTGELKPHSRSEFQSEMFPLDIVQYSDLLSKSNISIESRIDYHTAKHQLDILRKDNPELFKKLEKKYPELFSITGALDFQTLEKRLELIKTKYPKVFEKIQQNHPQLFTSKSKYDGTKCQLDKLREENPELFKHLQTKYPNIFNVRGNDLHTLQQQLEIIRTEHADVFEKIQKKHPQLFASNSEYERTKHQLDKIREENPELLDSLLKHYPELFGSNNLEDIHKQLKFIKSKYPKVFESIQHKHPEIFDEKSKHIKKDDATEPEFHAAKLELDKFKEENPELFSKFQRQFPELLSEPPEDLQKLQQQLLFIKAKREKIQQESREAEERIHKDELEKDVKISKHKQEEKELVQLFAKKERKSTKKHQPESSERQKPKGTKNENIGEVVKEIVKVPKEKKSRVSEKESARSFEKERLDDVEINKIKVTNKESSGAAPKERIRSEDNKNVDEKQKSVGTDKKKTESGEKRYEKSKVADKENADAGLVKEKGGASDREKTQDMDKNKSEVIKKEQPRGSEKDQRVGAEKEKGGAGDKEKTKTTDTEKSGDSEKQKSRVSETHKEKEVGGEKQKEVARTDKNKVTDKENKGTGGEIEKAKSTDKEKGGVVKKEKANSTDKEKGDGVEKEKDRGVEKEKSGAAAAEKGKARTSEKEKAREADQVKGNGGEKGKAKGAEKEKGGDAEKEKGGGAGKEKASSAEKDKTGAAAEKGKAKGAEKEKGGDAEKEKAGGANQVKRISTEKEKSKAAAAEKGKARDAEKEKGGDAEKEKAGGANQVKGSVEKEKARGSEKEKGGGVEKGKSRDAEKEKARGVDTEKSGVATKDKARNADKAKGGGDKIERIVDKNKRLSEKDDDEFDISKTKEKKDREMGKDKMEKEVEDKRGKENKMDSDKFKRDKSLIKEDKKNKLGSKSKNLVMESMRIERQTKGLQQGNTAQQGNKTMQVFDAPLSRSTTNVKKLQATPGLFFDESSIEISEKDIVMRRPSCDDDHMLNAIRTTDDDKTMHTYSFLDNKTGKSNGKSIKDPQPPREFIYSTKIVKQGSLYGFKEDAILFHTHYSINSSLDIPEQEEETEVDQHKTSDNFGIVNYALSDRSFIDKGWTMLPVVKVVRKVNLYRMLPTRPEFSWFERNKQKGLIFYSTREKLAEFDNSSSGRCHWYYKNEKLALDYYPAEEENAGQRVVIYSNGERDKHGQSRPLTVLATFDYVGNGIVFDHAGKTRLKYNQSEGITLDKTIGPVSKWKWNDLNDPPVLQQVMVDTYMPFKDPEIMRLGDENTEHVFEKEVDEEILALEFENFLRDQGKKVSSNSYKSFPICMKALKINENFSLKILDQSHIYLKFRDGKDQINVNLGMTLDPSEIIDTDSAEMGEITNTMERMPARTCSVAEMQRIVARAQNLANYTQDRQEKINPSVLVPSIDKLKAPTSRPLRRPLMPAVHSSRDTSRLICLSSSH